jgi:ferric-dicitrate binding protein FerR (iron transport regulator)
MGVVMDLPEAWAGRKVDTVRAADKRAIKWLIRLRSGHATLADARAYLCWRLEHPEHERAARDLALLWRMLADAARTFAEPLRVCPGCVSCVVANCRAHRRRQRSFLRRQRWRAISTR